MAAKRRAAAGGAVHHCFPKPASESEDQLGHAGKHQEPTIPGEEKRATQLCIFKPKGLRYGVRLELLDVLVEEQWPRAVLLVALEARSRPDFHTELEERAPLVQRHACCGGRLEEL